MFSTSIPVLAGIASTVIFASSVLPMLVKAQRTRDLGSYSLGNMLLANVGNAVHSVYVYSLPPGPIWALHGFYLVSTALMLVWFLRYSRWHSRRQEVRNDSSELRARARRDPDHRSRPSGTVHRVPLATARPAIPRH